MKSRLITLMILILMVFSAICILFAEEIMKPLSTDNGFRDVSGTLSYSVRTATYNGPYAPRNAGVIWITNTQNQFIKTLKVWAVPYRYTLVRWIADSGSNTTGAITGASLNSHQLHNVSWNATNYQGNLVPDGDYKINIEFTEHNASTNNPGKYKSITFTKSGEAFDTTYPNETWFRDMHLVWAPIVTEGTLSGVVRGTGLQPIAGAIISIGAEQIITDANGLYSVQLDPGVYSVFCSAEGYGNHIQDNVTVVANQTTTLNFDLLPVAISDALNSNAVIRLEANFPNPLLTHTTFRYYLPKSGNINLSLYNMRGQQISDIHTGFKSEGWHQQNWQAISNSGERIPAGRYIGILKTDSGSRAIKVSIR